MRPFSTHQLLFRNIKNVYGKKLFGSTTFSKPKLFSTFVGKSRPSSMPRLLGFTTITSLGLIAPWYASSHVIRNDVILDVRQPAKSIPEETGLPSRKRSRFNGKLDYRQLCIGSLAGVFLGIIVGKISSVLVFITACGFLGLQWLQNRGLVDKSSTLGLSKYIVKTGKENIDLNTLVWERPSFKVSFLLTFLLAAANI